MTSATGRESAQEGADGLTAWLTTLVHNRAYGDLAQLRRVTAGTSAGIRAGWYAPDQDHREIYEQVAFLFAVYHRGVGRPARGFGSLGTAARRIGSPGSRGPGDPGATRLVDRIVASRRIPWRHLQHAITRLRACEQQPPSWTDLVVDLERWNDRQARIAYHWAVDFHEPYQAGPNPQKGSST
ncbi:type I-E CRISPR-associated protein Cse2/CasB [Streptomyces sp. NPDC001530]|uniref:type I-E CRISPR-associated protein Cse2/CasB n=1 Tax=Streptomyces sp. NPDC001530 TaxID=3364582 RepID=UPI0036C955E2